VDGERAPILPADVMFRAVELRSPGRKHVVFEYHAPWAKLGVALSVMGVLGCVALGVRSVNRTRPRV